MQPLREVGQVQGMAWHIACNEGLNVVIAVIGKNVLLLSEAPDNKAPWRLGYYHDEAEARKEAVNMTSSYERYRQGRVMDPRVVSVSADRWQESLENKKVDEVLGNNLARSVMYRDLTELTTAELTKATELT